MAAYGVSPTRRALARQKTKQHYHGQENLQASSLSSGHKEVVSGVSKGQAVHLAHTLRGSRTATQGLPGLQIPYHNTGGGEAGRHCTRIHKTMASFSAHLPSSSPPNVARKRSLGEKARACTLTLCNTNRQYCSLSSNFHTITSACKDQSRAADPSGQHLHTVGPRSVHLEAHVGTLPGGEVGAAGGTGETGHVVGVSLQE